MKNTRINKFLKFIIVYTFLFVAILLMVTYKHILTGRTFIWLSDSWWQHYKAYIYIQTFYKEIIKNIFVHHTLKFSLWDMSIGEGSDIINTFCYYGLTDPFNIIGLFFPLNQVLISFHIMIISKMYFAGITFAYMCDIIISDKNKKLIIIIISSLLYAFCSWNILNMRRHHMFMNALVFVPLIIIGVEHLIKNKKTVLITLGVFLISISSLYYFYVSAIIVAIYTIVKVFSISKISIYKKISIIFKVLLLSILGILFSCFIFIPSAYYYFNDARANIKFDVPLFYPKEYYVDFFINFIIPSKRYYWLVCGYGIISVISLLLLFVLKKHYIEKILFILSTIFMLFPFFGHVFNAFSYISNKWVWSVSILINFIIYDTFNDAYKKINNNLYKKIFLSTYILLTILTILWNSQIFNSAKNDNNYMACGKVEDINNWILHDDAEALKQYKNKINDIKFSRYDTNYDDWNVGFLKNLPNISYYWTLTNKYLVDFRQQFYDRESWMNVFTNYDNRMVLDAISSVKYFVNDRRNNKFIPANSKLVDDNDFFEVYENNIYCNIAYVYDRFMRREDFNELDIGEKELTILNACVLDNKTNKDFIKLSDYDFSNSIVIYEDDDGYLDVEKDNNYINFTINNVDLVNDSYEYKLVFKNLNYVGEKEQANISIFGNNFLLNNIIFFNKQHQHYRNIHNFAANLKRNDFNNLTIIFDEEGAYTWDSLYIVALPVAYIKSAIKNLNESIDEELEVSKFGLSGNINVKKDGVLVLSVPYTKFWKVYLDGKQVEYYNANIKNIGINITKGKKTLKIVYDNILFRIGCIISITTVAICLICFILKPIRCLLSAGT